jgi:hypothetical protein
LRIYAREGVAHAWLIDPLRQTLDVLLRESGQWTLLDRHEGRVNVRAVPFDALELELGALWISSRSHVPKSFRRHRVYCYSAIHGNIARSLFAATFARRNDGRNAAQQPAIGRGNAVTSREIS